MEAAGCSRPAHNPAVTAAVDMTCVTSIGGCVHTGGGWRGGLRHNLYNRQAHGHRHTAHTAPLLTVQPDLALGLAQGVLADALVRAVVRGRDVGDGEARVEAVPLDLLLGVVPRRADDHHLVEHPEGNGLQ